MYSVLVGIPACLLCRLQSVMNAGARLIFQLRRSDHITDALLSLHWLRVPDRIRYKIAVLTYKVLHFTAPRYPRPLDRVADQRGRRALRSASSSRLVVPRFRLSAVGPSTSLDLGSGMDCPMKLFRHRHFQVFGADSNLSSFSSRTQTLLSNSALNTTVVLVVVFTT